MPSKALNTTVITALISTAASHAGIEYGWLGQPVMELHASATDSWNPDGTNGPWESSETSLLASINQTTTASTEVLTSLHNASVESTMSLTQSQLTIDIEVHTYTSSSTPGRSNAFAFGYNSISLLEDMRIRFTVNSSFSRDAAAEYDSSYVSLTTLDSPFIGYEETFGFGLDDNDNPLAGPLSGSASVTFERFYEAGAFVDFHFEGVNSSQAGNGSLNTTLTIDFITIPTPATATLATFAALTATRRRR